MKKVVAVVVGLLFFSCNKNINTETKDNKAVNSIQIEGKWIDSTQNLKLYIDTELEKIVFTNGCEVISSDFKRFAPAINFANLVKTQSTCTKNGIDGNKILNETVFLEINESNQLVFLDKNKVKLLILNKN
jgi:hypothetical protein